VSHDPVWPPAFVGQSVLEQHPVEAMQIPAVRHCLGVEPPQENPQFVPSQVAEPPVGIGQASHRLPQVAVDVLSTQPLGHMCLLVPVQAGVVPPAPAVPVVPPLPPVPAVWPLPARPPLPALPVVPAVAPPVPLLPPVAPPLLPALAPVPAAPPACPPVPPICPPVPPVAPPVPPVDLVPPAPPRPPEPALPSGPPSTGT
jgi:hypothetical protein